MYLYQNLTRNLNQLDCWTTYHCKIQEKCEVSKLMNKNINYKVARNALNIFLSFA